MTSLDEHWDAGSNYLSEGSHEVTIINYRTFVAHTGMPGVEFEVRGSTGKFGKISFYISEACLGFLAAFARSAGLTKEDCKNYDPMKNDTCHQLLMNRRIGVVVTKGEKYHEITDHYALDGDPPPQKAASAPRTETATAQGVPF